MRIIRFIHAWFYYSTFRDYLYQEGTRPAQTRFQFAKEHSKWSRHYRALKEKSVAKKPIYKFEYADGTQFYDCPVCGRYVMHAGVQSKEKYCSNCGQKLDWSE